MKLLLVGFNTRALAESCAAAGYSFVSLDCFGDLDHTLLGPVFSPRRPRPDFPEGGRANMESLVRWGVILAEREHCDSIAYASGLENRPDLLTKLLSETGCRLYGNSPCVLQQARDAVGLSHHLQHAGFHAPKTRLPDGQPLEKERRWLIKPLKSGGGHGVTPADQEGIAPEGSVYQEYINGKPCSFSFVTDGRSCLVLGITEQLTAARSYSGWDFGYAGNIFPLPNGNQKKLLDTVSSLARWLTAHYALRGLNGVDFILHGEECWVIEVNPRYSSSMELFDRAYVCPMAKLHVLACSGNWPEVEKEVEHLPVVTLRQPERIWIKRVIYTRTSKRVSLSSSDSKDEQLWARHMHARGLRDLPFPGDVIPARRPVATALASSATREGCFKNSNVLSALMMSQLTPARRESPQSADAGRYEADRRER